tara:strand:- start:7468 stop:8043 length:576 start_codon:yes stop_codon:yes gene_type:complete
MQNLVNIIADDMGNVVRQSSTNSEFGYVRLQQRRITFGVNGWVKSSNVSTLIHGKLEDLQEMKLNANETLAGKIIIKEQLDSFSTSDPDRDYKYAGDTGIVCCVDGQPIYRKTFFVPDTTAEDVLLAHTNSADIREANGNTTATKVKMPDAKSFGINTDKKEVVEDEVVNEEVSDEVEEEQEDLVEETFEL